MQTELLHRTEQHCASLVHALPDVLPHEVLSGTQRLLVHFWPQHSASAVQA